MSSELRQRKTDHPKGSSSATQQTAQKSASKGSSQLAGYMEQAMPYVQKGTEVISMLAPYAVMVKEHSVKAWKVIEPYGPEDLIPAFCGLIMCFFGGSYCTLIAAVEAYRMAGWDSTVTFLKDLQKDFLLVWEANKADDQEDLDGDGIADVKQISPQQLAQRKLRLVLITVDPQRLTRALAGLNAGFLAVVATLKVQFAKAITLGNAIGDALAPPAEMVLVPPLRMVLPDEYKKWAQPLVMYTVRSAAISVAWFLQRVISAFHSAVRGGTMCSRNLLNYLGKRGIIPEINHEDTYLDEIVGAALAGLGLLFQLSFGFQLPFPLNIILFPFTLMEWFLIRMVTSN
jgi:hypothetical protein